MKFIIDFCLDLNLTADEPSLPKEICSECLSRLKFIFEYKQFCKNNNDQYFRCKIESNPDLCVIKEEPCLKQDVVVDDSMEMGEDSLLVEVMRDIKEEPSGNRIVKRRGKRSSYTTNTRRRENARENTRRKLQRAAETDEERAVRRSKAAKMKRLQRLEIQANQPERYANLLAKEAENARMRRHLNRVILPPELIEEQHREDARVKRERRASETPEVRAARRAKSAAAARRRRERIKLENPEQYEAEKARAAEAKRIFRSKNPDSNRAKSLAEKKRFEDYQKWVEVKSEFIETKTADISSETSFPLRDDRVSESTEARDMRLAKAAAQDRIRRERIELEDSEKRKSKLGEKKTTREKSQTEVKPEPYEDSNIETAFLLSDDSLTDPLAIPVASGSYSISDSSSDSSSESPLNES